MIAKLALVAALGGSAVGAAAVLADDRAPAPVPAVAAASTPAEPTPPPMDARDVRVVTQAPDAKGGAPWAIRRFKSPLKNGTTVECSEVGRLDGERFGWIGASGAFAPTLPGHAGTPMICKNPDQERAVGVSVQRFTTLTQPENGALEPLETVTFGVAAPAITRLVPDDEPPLAPGADGIVLRIVAGDASPGRLLTGVAEYRDGHRVRFNRTGMPRPKGERPVAGTETVAVRAPDPAGGQPWALIATRGDRGGICVTAPGRLVGTRLASVDRRLGIAYPGFEMLQQYCPDTRKPPTRAFPMRLDVLGSSVGGEDPRGRIERRVLDNRTVYWGRVYEDVVSVTIRTPRDVRTLVPSGLAHAIIAVYDGGFPTGKVTATAHMKDGREVTRTLYSE
ncbi:hypothetical protein OM076_31810 [Solirubrobacter ginsenosidimutans]|uniref:Uncharacterized protein n=1 Tax=Solirubrobacter ginsenosidimutans TaxID=490573 RepID=A0A9X3MY41_9ACTN|nr:hypothetical protein [Solirubrobacter ginsenosidimutans]MDA0164899.1 hypothetical protein [Solirubrobacter ginsenosidimutans]